MTWLRDCGVDWALSFGASVLTFLGLMAFIVLIYATGLSGGWVVWKVGRRVIPESWVPKLIPAVVLALLGVLLAIGAVEHMDCNDCLPEFLRSDCEADRAKAEAADRARWIDLCDRWGWPECPPMEVE